MGLQADLEPKLEFDCTIVDSVIDTTSASNTNTKSSTNSNSNTNSNVSPKSVFSVVVMQLGSFSTFRFHGSPDFKPVHGMEIKCNMFSVADKNHFDGFVFVPVGTDPIHLPKQTTVKGQEEVDTL